MSYIGICFAEPHGKDGPIDLLAVKVSPEIPKHSLCRFAVGRLAGIRNLRRHPYEFYQKLGYVIIGAIPDANGFGKPDILMAKRISR